MSICILIPSLRWRQREFTDFYGIHFYNISKGSKSMPGNSFDKEKKSAFKSLWSLCVCERWDCLYGAFIILWLTLVFFKARQMKEQPCREELWEAFAYALVWFCLELMLGTGLWWQSWNYFYLPLFSMFIHSWRYYLLLLTKAIRLLLLDD